MFRDDLDIKPAACEEYEELLKRSLKALNEWKNGRAEIRRSSRKGRSADNELRMLQANFAKAYAALQTHSGDCSYCQMPALVHQGFRGNPEAHHYPLH
jgi:hypothetical protein